MSILRGLDVGRINLDLELFACVLHGSRQLKAWRKIVVVLGLEEENRSTRITDCAGHQSLRTTSNSRGYLWRVRKRKTACLTGYITRFGSVLDQRQACGSISSKHPVKQSVAYSFR